MEGTQELLMAKAGTIWAKKNNKNKNSIGL